MTATCPNGITVTISRPIPPGPLRSPLRRLPAAPTLHPLPPTARSSPSTSITTCSPPPAPTPSPPTFIEPYRQHRPMVERSIAWLIRRGGRKVRYRGIARNRIGLAHRCAAINLRRLINLGLHWDNQWQLAH